MNRAKFSLASLFAARAAARREARAEANRRRKQFLADSPLDKLEERKLLAIYTYDSSAQTLTITADATGENIQFSATNLNTYTEEIVTQFHNMTPAADYSSYTWLTHGYVPGYSLGWVDVAASSAPANLKIIITDGSYSGISATTESLSLAGASNYLPWKHSLTVNLTQSTSGPISINDPVTANQVDLTFINPANQISVNSAITANGSGKIGLAGRNISVTANLNTTAGNISLYGNGGGVYQAGTFTGVCISGSTVNVNTTGGNIFIDGRGALNTVTTGVRLDSSKVQAGVSGNVTITGVSGNGSGSFAYGIDISAACVTTSSGSITVNGTEYGIGGSCKGVYLQSSANISASGAGNVTITGTGANGTDYAFGVQVNNSNVMTSDGSLTINGTSCGTTDHSYGVILNSSANISATGAGNVTIIGMSGNGSAGTSCGIVTIGANVTTSNGTLTITGITRGTGNDDYGVFIDDHSNLTSSSSGFIQMTGNTVSGSGVSKLGVFINNYSQVSTGGNIVISGTSSGTGSGSQGVRLSNANISTNGAGTIVINGCCINTSDSHHFFGVAARGASRISTSNGDIAITGNIVGGVSSSAGIDIWNTASVIAGGSGNLTLTGISSSNTSAGDKQFGIWLEDSSVLRTVGSGTLTLNGTGGASSSALTDGIAFWGYGSANPQVSSGGGAIILNGVNGANSSSFGVNLYNQGNISTSANITITANSLNISSDSVVNATTAGNVLIQTLGAGVNLGGADSAANLGLTSAEINQITAKLLTIGNNTTGAIVNTAAIIRTGNLTLVSGNSITQSAPGNLTVSGTSNFVSAGAGTAGNITLNNTTNDFSTVTASGTNITISDTNAVALGTISATTLTVTSSGGAITQSDAITVSGTSNFVSAGAGTAGNITLNNTTNDFSTVTASGTNITISDTNAVALGTISATTLTVTSSGGAITQSDAITVSGTSNFVSSGSGTAGNITLNNATNNFGTVKASGTNISIADSDAITLSNITASGGLTVSGNVSASGITVTGPILATGSAAISLTGWNILLLNASIISNSGDIVLDSNSGTKTGSFSGIRLGNDNDSPANISTTSGNITLLGRGGNTGGFGRGVAILGGSIIGGGGAGKTVNITGYAGNSSDSSKGVNVYNSATRITSTGADINIIGYAGSNASDNYRIGVDIQSGNVNTTGAGNINVQGYGNSSAGISIDGGTNITALGTGAISLTGNLSSSATSLKITNANVVSNGGTISLISDDITISTTQANVNATSSGTVVMKPLNAGTAINLGTTISGSEINRITAGCLTIGSASAGNILVSDAINRSISSLGTNLSLISAGTITSTGSGNLAVSGTANFVSSGAGTAGNITLNNATNNFGTVTASGTNITVYDSSDITIGAITASGDFTVQGVNSTSCISVTGPIDATGGSGNVSLTGRNIVVTGNIISAAGDITLYGNGGGSYRAGSFDGVRISGSAVNVNTTTGNITIDGRGSAATSFSGIKIDTALVGAGGSGSLNLTGVSSNGSASEVNFGVWLNSTTISTVNGNVNINATSCGTGADSHGFRVESSNVTVTGNGSVSIDGISGTGVHNEYGILIKTYGIISTANGSITSTGRSRGTNSSSWGIHYSDAANMGFRANGSQGSISLIGITSNLSAYGLSLENGNVATDGGPITLTANSIRILNSGERVNATTSGTVTIQTLGAGINLGGADSSSNLGLEQNELDLITAGTLIIGNSTTGAILNTTAINRSNATLGTSLTLISGNSITQTGAGYLTVSGSSNFVSGGSGTAGNITLNNATNDFDTVTACGTNITVYDSSDITIGAITACGDFTVQGDNTTSCISVTGPVDATGGSGNVTLTGRNIIVTGNITSGAGDITLQANNGSQQSGSFYGIKIDGANLSTSGGNITANGRGGDQDAVGMCLVNGANLYGGGNGTISVIGQGGNSTNGSNACGIFIDTASTLISTNNGSILLEGRGGTTSGLYSNGIRLLDATIRAEGAGNVTLNMTGGISDETSWGMRITRSSNIIANGTGSVLMNGSGGTSNSTNAYGIGLSDSNVTAKTGKVIMNGNGGDSSGSAYGVGIFGSTQVLTTSGDIQITANAGGRDDRAVGFDIWNSAQVIAGGSGNLTITGRGGANTTAGNKQFGIWLEDSSILRTDGTGTLTLNGTGGAYSSALTDGIYFDGYGSANHPQVSSGSGVIILNGVNGANSSSFGVNLYNQGNISTSTNITITANSLNISSDSVVNATTAGNVLIQTLGAGVNLGGADDSANLGLSQAELNQITANLLTIGNSTTGAIVNTDAIDRSNATLGTSLTLISGSSITQTGAGNLTISGTANFVSGGSGTAGNITLNNATNDFGTVTASGTNITVYDSSDITIGAITACGDFTVQGDNTTSCISVTGPVDATGGSGNVTLTGRNIIVTGNITSGAGDITLYGNGGGSYQTGTFDGVCISGSTVNVNTTSGNIRIDGRGGLNTACAGVNLDSSKVQAGGSGGMTIRGVSGNGLGGDAFGIYASGANVTTSSGAINVNGTSSGSGDGSFGVYLKSSANISATGAGNVSITGTAANGQDNALGVWFDGAIVTTSSGSITVNGTSFATGNGPWGSWGVYLSSSANISATGAGNVTITGSTPGNTSTGVGIFYLDAASKVYSNGGLITLTANSVNLTGTVNATTAGNVLIQTLGAGVDLGNGTDTSANLGLSQTELNQITANVLTIGNSTTGAIVNTAAISRSNATLGTNLTLISSNSITQTGAGYLTVSGSSNFVSSGSGTSGNITLNNATNDFGTVTASGTNILIDFFNYITISDVTASGDFTVEGLNSTGRILVSGQVNATSGPGAVTLNGRNVEVTGNISTASGNINLFGNRGVTQYSGPYHGVWVHGSSVNVNSTGGNITIDGRSGGSLTYAGIKIDSATIATVGSGAISMSGQVDNSTYNSTTGINIYAGNLTTVNGSIDLIGSSNTTGLYSTGLSVSQSSCLSISGAGNLNMSGTANGSNSTTGIDLQGSSFVTNNGTLTVNGISCGTASDAKGVSLLSSALSSTGSGDLNLTGTSGNGSGSLIVGFYVTGGSIITNSGSITIQGNSRAGSGTDNSGVLANLSSNVTAGGSGTVSITGETSNTSQFGINLDSASGKIWSNGGQITLSANRINLVGTVNATSSGQVLIQTLGSGVDLGGLDDSANLGLSQSEFNKITSNMLIVGNSSTGAIVNTAAISRGNLTLISAASITQSGSGNLTISGTANFVSSGIGTSGNITLNNATNNFGTVLANGTNITIVDSSSVTLDSVTARGNLTVQACNPSSSISTTSTITVTGGGTANLSANGPLTLTNGGLVTDGAVNFLANGLLTITGSGINASTGTGSINLTSTGNGVIVNNGGIAANAPITIQAAGNTSVASLRNNASVSDISVTTTSGTLTSNQSAIYTAGNLTFSAPGLVTVTDGGINTTSGSGNVSITSTGAGVVVSSSGIQSQGSIQVSATGQVTVTGSGINTTSGSGNVSITSTGAGVVVDGTGIQSHGSIEISAAGSSSVSAITNTGGSGDVTISTSAGTLTSNQSGITTSGNVSLIAAGPVTVADGGINACAGTGSVTVTSNSGGVTATGPIYAKGNINISGSSSIATQTINNSGGTGNVTISSSGGTLTSNQSGITTAGNVSLIAAGPVTVADGGINACAGTGSVTVTSNSGGVTASGSIYAKGNITISAASSVSAQTLDNAGGTGNVNVTASGGSLSFNSGVTTSGNVTACSTGALTVTNSGINATTGTGDISLTSSSSTVTINQGGVRGKGAVSVSAVGPVLITSSGINNTGGTSNVTVTSSSAGITANLGGIQSNRAISISAAGASSFENIDNATGSGSITISTSSSSLTINTSGVSSAGDISLSAPGLVTVAGPLDATAGGGNITIKSNTSSVSVQSGVLANQVTITANNLDIGSTGGVNATTSGTVQILTNGGGVILGGAGDSGNLGIVQSELNNITAGSLIIGNSTTGAIVNTAAINRSNATLGTNLTLVSGNSITQTGAGNLTVSGTANFVTSGSGTSGNITLGNATNDFGTLTASGTNITVSDATGIQFGTLTATGDLTANGVAGAITQAAGTNISVSGTANFVTAGTGTSGNITLANATNDFGTFTASGTNITVSDATGIQFGTLTATGDLTANGVAGPITQDSGTNISVSGTANFVTGGTGTSGNITLANATNDYGTFTASGTNITVSDATGIQFGTLTATGDLTANGVSGAITQAAGKTMNVSGTANFVSAGSGTAGNITLANATNDFGTFTASGTNITVTDATGIQFGTLTATGDLTANGVTGAITQAAGTNISVSGTANFVTSGTGTAGNITLANATNNFTTVTASGTNITLTDANNITLGSIVPSGDLRVTGTNITITADISNPGQLQSYTGAVINGSGSRNLTAANVNLSSTLSGADAGFTITGNANVTGTIGNITALHVTGDATFGSTVGISGTVSNLTIDGATGLGGDVVTNGFQNYTGAVTLNTDITLTANSNGSLTFGSTVDGATIGGEFLKLNTGGTVTMNAAVGATNKLSTIETDALGTTNLKSVTTSGNQTYNDAHVFLDGTYTTTNGQFYVDGTANLSAAATVTTGSGNVTFHGTVDGGQTLVVNSTGKTDFDSAVGSLAALTSLTTNAGGTTNLKANVTTSGVQAYHDDISTNGTYSTTNSAFTVDGTTTLSGNTTVATGSGAATFTGAVNGPQSLTVNSTGVTTFSAAVGNSTALTSFTTNAGGSTSISANITTTGAQNYNDAVTLGGHASLATTNSDINFGGSINNNYNLSLAVGTANIAFGGPVGNSIGLNTIKVTSANIISAASTVQAADFLLNGGELQANTAFTTNLKVDGGTANIQSAGSLTGNANLVSGNLVSANFITGTLAVNGGTANMQTGAVITGLATLAGGSLTSNAAFNGGLTATGGTLYTLHNGTTTTNLNFGAASVWNANGSTLSDFGTIKANGSVTIASGANLTLAVPPMLCNQSITLINNTGSGAVSGSFSGLSQGTYFTRSGMPLAITYSGGSGSNDVIVTDTPRIIIILGGNNQTAASGSQFGSNLTVQVMGGAANETPVNGANLIFQLPVQVTNCNIASGYFNSVNNVANLTANILTDSNGNASISLSAGVNPGPFNIQPVVNDFRGVYNTYNLGVVGLAVQKQSVNRSFVRYLDLVLSDPTSIPDLTALNSNIVLQKVKSASLTGGANITPVNLTLSATNAVKTTVGWMFDFGTAGIGGNGAETITDDGVYQFANATSPSVGLPSTYQFHRLLGDANGDKVVDAADTTLVNSLTSSLAWRYNNANTSLSQGSLFYVASNTWAGDANGDGRVNATDINITGRWRGRRVTY